MKRVKNIYMLFCRSCDLTPTQKLYRKDIEVRDCSNNLEYLQFRKVSEATDYLPHDKRSNLENWINGMNLSVASLVNGNY